MSMQKPLEHDDVGEYITEAWFRREHPVATELKWWRFMGFMFGQPYSDVCGVPAYYWGDYLKWLYGERVTD